MDDQATIVEDLVCQCLQARGAGDAAAIERLLADQPADVRELVTAMLGTLDRVGLGGDATPTPTDTRATLFGPYLLLQRLGAGTMGVVYRARDPGGTERAVKLLQPGLLPVRRARLRFEREIQALRELDHAGICPILDAGEVDGVPFLVMPLLVGESLQARFARGPARGDVPRQHLLAIVEQVASALHHAHERGFVHRDVKPANILVRTDGCPVVLDFGLARLDRDDAATLSQSHEVIGAPAYMAPEQIADGRAADRRCDVYALGVLLYEGLTGRCPYEAATRESLYRRILTGELSPPSHRASDVPAPLDVVCLTALAREPNRRYQTAADLAADLARVRAGQRPVAQLPGRLERTWRGIRRNPLPSTLVASILLTAVVGAVVSVNFAWTAQELAQEKAGLADAESKAKGEAQRAAEQLGEKVREFDQLKGVVLYERAIEGEKKLYPAWPSKVEAMETWLRDDAGKVLAMKDEIGQTVRDLESRALPPTSEEQEADRRSHPRFAAFELLGKRVASLRYAQAIREGMAQLVAPDLTAAQQALDAKALNSLAWLRVAPPAKAGKPEERTIYGEEAFGLACARAAVAKAYATDGEHQVLDTLAWALLANGQDAEAKAKSAEALGNAPDNEYETFAGHQRDLDAAVTNAAEILAATEQQLAGLGKAVNERRTFRFELEAHHFLHDTLAELLRKLGSLEAKEKAEVDRRLSWAKQIQGLSLAHPNAKHARAAVRAAIASNAKYAGQKIELRDEDITGLVPIGENPVTKLWEFYELRSAWDGKADPRTIAIPAHEIDGSIKVTGDTGIVFVLLPGGKFTMGAQRDDKDKPNFDPQADGDEMPHEVTLAPFFLARHEMTQGQWARLWSGDESLRWPSLYKVGRSYPGIPVTIGPSHPVESVDWAMCDTLLRRSGMSLPTEAQWEFGCRAGTATPWYTGELPASLVGHGNVIDRDAVKSFPEWGIAEAFEDGFSGPAPVGHYRGSNAFGLYDVHGNAREWCRDAYGGYSGPVHEGDALRLRGDGSSLRCVRGGSFVYPAAFARSANRWWNAPSVREAFLGLRCARTLRP